MMRLDVSIMCEERRVAKESTLIIKESYKLLQPTKGNMIDISDKLTEVVSVDRLHLTVRKLVLANPNKWIVGRGTLNGKEYEFKIWDTWIQIYRVDGINYANNCGQTGVRAFKRDLERPFTC